MKLQEWFNSNKPDESLIYSRAAISQVLWVRDTLAWMVFKSLGPDHPEIKDFIDTLHVEGTHTSKSVELPVYKFIIGDTKIKVRGNFHDWCVHYWGPSTGENLPEWMEIYVHTGFYEGMAGDRPQLKFCVSSKEYLFAVLWQLLNEKHD